jgi:hypothetical protein
MNAIESGARNSLMRKDIGVAPLSFLEGDDPTAAGATWEPLAPVKRRLPVSAASIRLCWQGLLKAVPQRAAMLIVGDVDQLPSVGPRGWVSPVGERRRLSKDTTFL